MEVLSTPSNPSPRSHISRSASAQRYMPPANTQVYHPPAKASSTSKLQRRVSFGISVELQRWMKLAEQKPWGKSLMKRWVKQNVLDQLTLEDITDEILKDFNVQKLQRVVLLKWKRQVLAGEDSSSGFSPSRSADRYVRSASARPAGTPKLHQYQPSRSVDRRQRPSRSEGRSSSARRQTQRPRDPLVELFAHFDKGTGWVDQGVLFDLMFSTLRVHRKRVIEANPHAPMLSKEEIQPLVNGLVWEVMKKIELQRSGFLSLQEYLKCSKLLIIEFEKIVAKQKRVIVATNAGKVMTEFAENNKRSPQDIATKFAAKAVVVKRAENTKRSPQDFATKFAAKAVVKRTESEFSQPTKDTSSDYIDKMIVEKSEPVDSDSDDDEEVKNDIAVSPSKLQPRENTIKIHMPEHKKSDERKIGEELMLNVVQLCKVWHTREGNTNQLVQFLKHAIDKTEADLRKLNSEHGI